MTNLVTSKTSVGKVMTSIHCPLVDDDGREFVNVLGHINGLVILLNGVGQHVDSQGEINVAIHLLR
jgi:hypothetical protein